MKLLRLDELQGIPVFGTLVWKPVRRTLGITAFGINAYTAANAGDEVIEDHTEASYGHEEVYAVISGRATFTVDGSEIDAPVGTLVYLDDPSQRRRAVAQEPGTTVLAIGGVPGTHAPSAWESFFPALPAIGAGDYDTARELLEGALRENDQPRVRYQLACVEARAGSRERALEQLRLAVEGEPELADAAREDEDFTAIRTDPRFPLPRD